MTLPDLDLTHMLIGALVTAAMAAVIEGVLLFGRFQHLLTRNEQNEAANQANTENLRKLALLLNRQRRDVDQLAQFIAQIAERLAVQPTPLEGEPVTVPTATVDRIPTDPTQPSAAVIDHEWKVFDLGHGDVKRIRIAKQETA